MADSIEAEYSDFASRNAWTAEFEKIRETCSKYDYTFIEAKKPENAMYNRYMDICPYDHSRVILKKSQNNYINANIVKIEKANKQYILTQGPTVNSTPHFWRMLWEHNCKAIIMLNKRIENDKVKCSMYWPGNTGPAYKLQFPIVGLTVEQLTDDSHTYYSTRIMRITDIETNAYRDVIQFHYITWPDFGVPSSPTAFLEFLYKVRASGAMDASVGPPVVHCSAGVGRSGTFCLVDSCLVMIEKYGENSVNVREVLLEMRRYRMGLIQTPDQLRFSYQAIIKGAQQLKEDHVSKANGNDEDLSQYDDASDAPPVPPPRAASLKTNSKIIEEVAENQEGSDYENTCEEPITNGIKSGPNEYHPLTKELPDIPSDSEEEEDDASSHDEKEITERKLPDIPVSNNKEETLTISEQDNDKEGLRRRQLNSQKSANLQERVQEMKRKQQKAEQWQQKKRSIYIPMTITLGILTCGALAYIYFKN